MIIELANYFVYPLAIIGLITIIYLITKFLWSYHEQTNLK